MSTQESVLGEIEFEISRDDYWAFNLFVMRRLRRRLFPLPSWVLPTLLGVVVLLGTVLSILLGDVGWIVETARSPVGVIVGLLLLLVLLLAIVLLASRRLIKNLPDEKSGTLGHHRLRLTDHGVHDETLVGKSFNAWSGVLEIAQDDDHVYLFVDRMAAHIVPKRVFDAGALGEFLALCTQRQTAAHPS
jgi:hypothetical protein